MYHATPSSSPVSLLPCQPRNLPSGTGPTQTQTQSHGLNFFSVSVAGSLPLTKQQAFSDSRILGESPLLRSPGLFPVCCPCSLWALGTPTGLQLTPAQSLSSGIQRQYPEGTLFTLSFLVPSVGQGVRKPHSHLVVRIYMDTNFNRTSWTTCTERLKFA